MDKISIIIPVYNSEPYIRKCLDSVVSQTYTNLEILLIDDGSSDKSVEICSEYAEKDSRIRVFKKETKGGSGSPCRSANIGLKNFTGRYVGYVEPDDWIEPDMYEVLYNTVKSNGASVGIVNYFNNDTPRQNKLPFTKTVLEARDLIDYTFDDKNRNGFGLVVQWNKLYSADIFGSNRDLLYNTELTLAFDLLFSINVYLTEGCTAAYTDKPLYHYRVYNSSISHSNENMFEKAYDTVKAFKIIDELLVKNNYDDPTDSFRRNNYVNRLIWLALECIKRGDQKLCEQTMNDLRELDSDRNYLDLIEDFPKKYIFEERYGELKALNNQNILLFGSGGYGQNAKERLELKGITAKCFVDNDDAKRGKEISGIEVINLDDSLKIPDRVYIITVHFIHINDVYNQLITGGVDKRSIYIF